MRSLRNLTFQLAVPLLIWCILLDPLLFHTDPTLVPSRTTLAGTVFGNLFSAGSPEFPYLWYLFALISWRLWGFLLAALRPGAKLLLALCMSALGGYAELSHLFKLDYAVACFPIFVAGQVVGPALASWSCLLGRCTRMMSGGLLAAILSVQMSAAGRAFVSEIPVAGWPHLVTDFCTVDEARMFWVRGLCRNALELTKGVLFLICCPRSPCFMTELGQRTLYPYLLHPVAMYWCEKVFHGLPNTFADRHNYLKLFVMPCILAAALASWPVRPIFRVFLEPAWLERILGACEG